MNKYVAYVSSYTQNNKYGITIFDVDMKKGRFTKKGEVEVSNSSYIPLPTLVWKVTRFFPTASLKR